MKNTRTEPINTLEYIENLTVTLIRATAEHNKHNGEFFDKAYVEHNPMFYKLDTTGRALFVKIVSEILKVNFYFGDSYTIKPMQTPEQAKKEHDQTLKRMLTDKELTEIGRSDLVEDEEETLYRCEDCGDRIAKNELCSCDERLRHESLEESKVFDNDPYGDI